jgi:site-specific DNA-adenine methylase
MQTYNGGKSGSGTYQQIINHIPPHNIYIEPFAGHIGIFRKIRRSSISILNDTDPEVFSSIVDYCCLQRKEFDHYHDFFQGSLLDKPTKPIVILRNNDYSVIMDRFKENADAFIYCDPPYPMHKRISQQKLYRFDWEREDQHADFLKLASNCKCAVMISSYPNDQYNAALKGWHTHKFYSTIRGGRRAEEIIYMNYPPPVILHDFQYLGKNYRERDNLKRKVKRNLDKLNRLPANERTAIISSIIQIYKETVETLVKL